MGSNYIGKDFLKLPTPCFVIDEAKFDANCLNMIRNVRELETASGKDIKFRPHVKTHKTIEGLAKQLGHGLVAVNETEDAIVFSTIKEAEGILDYQEESGNVLVRDICYSLPACIPEILERLDRLSTRASNLRVFVDNIEHLNSLLKFGPTSSGKKWSYFIKIDMGTHRAGLMNGTKELEELLSRASAPEISEVAELYGFYAHAGHSYSVTNISEAHDLLVEEILAVNEAAKHYSSINPQADVSSFVLSVGATPTSGSLKLADQASLIEIIKNSLVGRLEIHCGNYCMYDLQQLSTGCVQDYEIAGFVLGSIVSVYRSRGEVLTNTGVLSLTRETSRFPGHGIVVDPGEILNNEHYEKKWFVEKVSQEHGKLKRLDENSKFSAPELGSKIAILPQHACIVAGCFNYYFVIDSKGIVTDVWRTIKGW